MAVTLTVTNPADQPNTASQHCIHDERNPECQGKYHWHHDDRLEYEAESG